MIKECSAALPFHLTCQLGCKEANICIGHLTFVIVVQLGSACASLIEKVLQPQRKKLIPKWSFRDSVIEPRTPG